MYPASPKLEMGERLRQLNKGLLEVIAQYTPSEAAIEETFVNRDPQSALKLGQARGVALMAPATARLLIAEYAANLVKNSRRFGTCRQKSNSDDGARAIAGK